MGRIEMRVLAAAEIPEDAGTAVQESPERPVFRGTGGDDYVCAACGNVLATGMAPEYMNRKLRIRCASCRAINGAIEVEGVDYDKAFGRRREHYS
jgi:DNA-directed RNA polymerase subunit RPC12/RpoP